MTRSLSSRLLPLGIAIVFLSGGCALRNPLVTIPIEIPARPTLQVCPELPDIKGRIVDLEDTKTLLLTLEDAFRLRDFIHTYMTCAESNEVELLGHIEKLENRLKAYGN